MFSEEVKEMAEIKKRLPALNTSGRLVSQRRMKSLRWQLERVLGGEFARHTDETAQDHLTWQAGQLIASTRVAVLTGQPVSKVRTVVRTHRAEGSCPLCAGRDPQAEHRVYVFYFDHLKALKVGVTHCLNDKRLNQHRAAGGQLRQIITVPSYQQALAVERKALTLVTNFRLPYSQQEFPQGGWTECWSITAPPLDLTAIRESGD
ncbi:hypothetical protein AAIH32_13075 [Pseudarthrobacter oxydans]|uniref:hypothetical protein n=1 Tax=Pseudarthrobacter oxydans TaxID=1671 RepID=UPI003D2C4039